MPKHFKIIFDKEACIGAFNCISLDPRNWKMAPFENKKVDLANAIFDQATNKFESVVSEEEVQLEAEATCPSAAIKIVEISEEEAEAWREKAATAPKFVQKDPAMPQ